MWLILLASLVPTIWAAASDPACTADTANPPVKLSPTALSCEDKDPDLCALVFGAAASTAASRAAGCIKDDASDATKPDAKFKKLAIEKCAQYCGYCCLSPENNCENKPYSQTGLNCTTMSDKCTDPGWRPLIAENCPATCGMCLEGGCVDIAPDCSSQPTVCFNANFVSWAKTNCARTCNQCTPSTGGTTSGMVTGTGATVQPGCADSDTNCAIWARNGKFCNNAFYQAQWSKCRKSCGKC